MSSTIQGKLTRIRIYEQDAPTDWLMAVSKLCWFAICILFPFALFRLLHDLFNSWIASAGVGILLLIIRISGPLNLVMLDELAGRIFPSLRTATRSGRIPVDDFRLRQSSGVETACILKGHLIGTVPVVGDMLTLNGRARSGSMFWVRDGRIENVNTVLGIQQRYSGFFFVLTVVMMTIFILFLQGVLDQWLYPHLEKIILNST